MRVRANHFLAKLPTRELVLYHVGISPEVTSRGVNRAVINQMVQMYRRSHLGDRLPVYDGRASLYTAGLLPHDEITLNVELEDEEPRPPGSRPSRRDRNFRIMLRLASRANLHDLEQFLAGRQRDVPYEALQALDIVFRELPTTKFAPVGRSFYSPELGKPVSLEGGLCAWRGFYQSLRPTQQGLSLNIDMSSTAFLEPIKVTDFLMQLLDRRDFRQPLTDYERVKVRRVLKGVRVEVTHRGDMRRKHRIAGLTTQKTSELTFSLGNDGNTMSVVEYFRNTYTYQIQFLTLPCLQVGSEKRPNYLPMEVCKIVQGQRYPKKLNERQVTNLLRVTCQRPSDRERDIKETVRANNYSQDPYVREFGLDVRPEMAQIDARVLEPPRLRYHSTSRESEVLPSVGQWNLLNKASPTSTLCLAQGIQKMVNPGKLERWACINFTRLPSNLATAFARELASMCKIHGCDMASNSVLPVYSPQREPVEQALRRVTEDCKKESKGEKLQLILCLLPTSNGSLYGDIKRILETEIGVVSQCCLEKHVGKMAKQYMANVALKINVKVGGRNAILSDTQSPQAGRLRILTSAPTIIFGADVTHPNPGEDSAPSIAAVVASIDWPEASFYRGNVRAQSHRQELIEDLYKPVTINGITQDEGMVRELLLGFYRKNRQRKPERILFFRDGVSEGQFNQVLDFELAAICKACEVIEPNYRPRITFVVVQKRHHTRLFPLNHQDRSSTDRSGNILPGTVVDQTISHPTEFDFYLCSHAGIQGTSRPAHYHVLHDENGFTADALQTLTHDLCYTYARCTRSVSIVPAAYYAHLAAFRARFYASAEPSEGGSATFDPFARSSTAGGPGPEALVRQLPPLCSEVKQFMFYC
eukprot:SM000128S26198  [mRNA]  locus=s128:42629:48102:- [translate_table: standard]